MKSLRPLAVTLLTALTLSASALAQDNNNDRSRRNFNPEEFRKQMAERLKGSLKASDEEWTVLQPLIETVTNKQRESMSGRFGGGRRGSNDNDSTPRPGAEQSDALRKALESESTPAEEIKAKLAAVREQRKKSAAELAAARADLQKVLTTRQEAVLVSYGILE